MGAGALLWWDSPRGGRHLQKPWFSCWEGLAQGSSSVLSLFLFLPAWKADVMVGGGAATLWPGSLEEEDDGGGRAQRPGSGGGPVPLASGLPSASHLRARPPPSWTRASDPSWAGWPEVGNKITGGPVAFGVRVRSERASV